MGFLSFSSKNKQESTDDGNYVARDDENALARSKRATTAGEPAERRTRERKPGAADPMLPEKKRARRRLVGSVALALAVAIGLPMILDSEPRPVATNIDIHIPSKEKAAPQPLPRAVADADALDAKEEIVEPTPAVAEVKAEPAKPEPVPAKLEAKPEHKAEVKAEAKPEHKPEAKPVKPETKPEAKPAARKEEEKKPAKDAQRAMAILEGKAEDKAAADKPQKYVVQVAALASQDKVDELQGKLRAAGIASFTRKAQTESGERIRVQIGPFSKEEAEKVRAKLKGIGLSGMMVAN